MIISKEETPLFNPSSLFKTFLKLIPHMVVNVGWGKLAANLGSIRKENKLWVNRLLLRRCG